MAQSLLDPLAPVTVERAVVQRNDAGPVRACRENRLIPDLCLRACIREDDRAVAFLDCRDHLREHLRAEVPGPGESLDKGRDQRIDHNLLRLEAANGAAPRRRASTEEGARPI